MYKKLRFKVDYEQDVAAFFGFWKDANYDRGRNWRWAISSLYKEFKKYDPLKSGKPSRREIANFVEKKYIEGADEIETNLSRSEKLWRSKEKQFYKLVQDLFPPSYWPDGEYIAYPTIWGMFPRNLRSKTFQIPARRFRPKKRLVAIIAHELLHFIFYNYFLKEFPEYKKGEYQMRLWHISEIFNEVVQGSKTWIRVFGNKPLGYPEHTKIVRKLLRKFNKRIDADELIAEICEKSINFK